MKAPDPILLEKCRQVLQEAGVTEDQDLVADMMYAAIRLGTDKPGRGDMKLLVRSFKELRYAFKVFKPYRNRRKVSMFGSARTPAEHPNYVSAQGMAKLLAEAGFMVITGAGGGIMAAGHEGAGEDASFGVAIKLPFEQKTNDFIARNEKLIHFRYFFSRKLVFVKETHAIVLYPGGFGTHDEGFEVLTLVQTGRCDPLPIVMVEEKGGGYWKAWEEFVKQQLIATGLVSPEDPALYFITDDPRAGVAHIARFYRNYHSLRYVNDELVMRIKQAPTAAELERIRADDRFRGMLLGGTFELRSAAAAEREPEIVPELPRLCFRFDRRSMAYLRLLIDELNALPSLPPEGGGAQARAADVGSDQADRMVGEIAEEEGIQLSGPGA